MDTIKGLFASRKFLTALVAAGCVFANKYFGFDLKPEEVALVIAPFVAHIAATAHEDAAESHAEAAQLNLSAAKIQAGLAGK